MKENKKLFMLTSFLMLLPIAAGMILWGRLPESIATHFDFGGNADGYSSRAAVVFALPVFMLAVHIICAFGVSADKANENGNFKAKSLVMWICPIVSVTVFTLIYAKALGYDIDIVRCSMLLSGFLFMITGNYMPKFRQNHTIGIRLPWTLASEENWYKTHRLAGKIWVVGGIVLLVGTLTPFCGILFAAVIAAITLIPTVYSAKIAA